MKILILNWKDLRNPDVGGAEIITYELAKRLVANGHEVNWFCRAFKGSAPVETVDGITIVRQGNLLTTYLYAYLYYRSLREKPDLVVDMVNTLCWQTPLYVKGPKIAYVNQLAREVFFYELPFPLSYVAYWLEDLEYRTYRRTPALCYSNSTKRDLIAVGIPAENIKVFPLGLDHERYVPAGKSPTPLFICVGRLARMKRFDLSVRAMEIVCRSRPDAKLAIVGYGPQKRALQKLVSNLGLEHNVFIQDKEALFFGKVEGDIKVKLMQQAWALLMPSVKEGWGMVVTEANACGTPAIVSDVSGLRESVVAGETGIILSENPTPDELAEAILDFIQEETLRCRLAQNSLLQARKLNWVTSFATFEALITTAAGLT